MRSDKFKALFWSWGLLTMGAYLFVVAPTGAVAGPFFIVASDIRILRRAQISLWRSYVSSSIGTMLALSVLAFPGALFASAKGSPRPGFTALVGVLWALGIWWVYSRWRSGQKREAQNG
jgi:hypothetical protein